MAICRQFGRPHLFVTFTASSKWEATFESMFPNEKSTQRPDLVVRTFNRYLKELLHDLKYKQILGKIVALVRVIEFQKRGVSNAKSDILNHRVLGVHFAYQKILRY